MSVEFTFEALWFHWCSEVYVTISLDLELCEDNLRTPWQKEEMISWAIWAKSKKKNTAETACGISNYLYYINEEVQHWRQCSSSNINLCFHIYMLKSNFYCWNIKPNSANSVQQISHNHKHLKSQPSYSLKSTKNQGFKLLSQFCCNPWYYRKVACKCCDLKDPFEICSKETMLQHAMFLFSKG